VGIVAQRGSVRQRHRFERPFGRILCGPIGEAEGHQTAQPVVHGTQMQTSLIAQLPNGTGEIHLELQLTYPFSQVQKGKLEYAYNQLYFDQSLPSFGTKGLFWAILEKKFFFEFETVECFLVFVIREM
jgi:hypothetical protein